MEGTEQTPNRVQDVAATANGMIHDAAQTVKDRTETAKDKVAQITGRVAVGVSLAADHVAQAAADPEKREALQAAVADQIRRNPWLMTAAAFVLGVRVGRRLHWR